MGPESAQGKKKGARKARAEESNGDGDPNQPPKKKGKKKEKDTSGRCTKKQQLFVKLNSQAEALYIKRILKSVILS